MGTIQHQGESHLEANTMGRGDPRKFGRGTKVKRGGRRRKGSPGPPGIPRDPGTTRTSFPAVRGAPYAAPVRGKKAKNTTAEGRPRPAAQPGTHRKKQAGP